MPPPDNSGPGRGGGNWIWRDWKDYAGNCGIDDIADGDHVDSDDDDDAGGDIHSDVDCEGRRFGGNGGIMQVMMVTMVIVVMLMVIMLTVMVIMFIVMMMMVVMFPVLEITNHG